jgi:hypothetical protein
MKTPSTHLYFVFDVESIGLHGEGFAVGYVVKDIEGNEHDCGKFSCLPSNAVGGEDSYKWVRDNIPEMKPTHDAPWLVRAAFWRAWLKWKEKGAVMAADCPWPVEARFLAACVDDSPGVREWQGPYPLIDVGSVILANGGDPKGKFDRLESERPEHDPLNDARQSARLLIENLSKVFSAT